MGRGCSVVRHLRLRIKPAQQRIRTHQSADGRPLLIAELPSILRRIQQHLALSRRKLTELLISPHNRQPPILRQTPKLRQYARDLLLLRRLHALQRLVALDGSLPLLWRHVVQSRQLVVQAFLLCRTQIVEARLVLQRLVLLRRREIPMRLHPRPKVLRHLRGMTAIHQRKVPGRTLRRLLHRPNDRRGLTLLLPVSLLRLDLLRMNLRLGLRPARRRRRLPIVEPRRRHPLLPDLR